MKWKIKVSLEKPTQKTETKNAPNETRVGHHSREARVAQPPRALRETDFPRYNVNLGP